MKKIILFFNELGKNVLRFFSRIIIKYLTSETKSIRNRTTNSPELLAATIQPGDVLLVEGNQRISTTIKYLTQSTWSHSAIYVGPIFPELNLPDEEPYTLIEADLQKGVIPVQLSKYSLMHTRICRPINLREEDFYSMTNYLKARLGHTYDIKNIFDLARYLFPAPPVPPRFRRKLLAFGSGDPTKVICSTIIAQAFHSIQYPIFPKVVTIGNHRKLQFRHYSLFTPSDFDLSPYFQIVKPTLAKGFDYKKLDWIAPSVITEEDL